MPFSSSRSNCDWKRGASKTGEYEAIPCHSRVFFVQFLVVLLSCPWLMISSPKILYENPDCSRWAQAGRHTQHALNRLSGKNSEFHSVKWAYLKILHCTCQVCFLHFVLYDHHRNHEITKSLSTGPSQRQDILKSDWTNPSWLNMAQANLAQASEASPDTKSYEYFV